MIRTVKTHDIGDICRIYNYYVENTSVTFEETSVSMKGMKERIDDVLKTSLPWLVLEEQGKVIGYGYGTKWKSRTAYKFSLESTIYLDREARGKGSGTALYSALIEEIRKKRIHAVIGGIALPNAASIALHEKLGFSKVAHFKEVGYKFNKWIDVGYWELLLDEK